MFNVETVNPTTGIKVHKFTELVKETRNFKQYTSDGYHSVELVSNYLCS